MSYEDVLIREATTDPTQQEIDEREETVLDTGDESPNQSTETGRVLLHSKIGQSSKFCPRCNMPTYRHKLSRLMDCGNDCKDKGLL